MGDLLNSAMKTAHNGHRQPNFDVELRENEIFLTYMEMIFLNITISTTFTQNMKGSC